MPGEETCRVVRRHRREGPVSERDFFWFEAIGPDGSGRERVIAQSPEWEHAMQGWIQVDGADAIHARNVQREESARAGLVQALLDAGWQVVATNERGLPTSFRRSVAAVAGSEPLPDAATLLKALDDLRRAGLLSDEEYQSKRLRLPPA